MTARLAQAGGDTARGWCLTPGTQCTGNTFSGLVITDSGGKAFLLNNETCTNNAINSARFQDNLRDGLSENGTDDAYPTMRKSQQSSNSELVFTEFYPHPARNLKLDDVPIRPCLFCCDCPGLTRRARNYHSS